MAIFLKICIIPFFISFFVGDYYLPISTGLGIVLSLLFSSAFYAAYIVIKYKYYGSLVVGVVRDKIEARSDTGGNIINSYRFLFYLDGNEYIELLPYKTTSAYELKSNVDIYISRDIRIIVKNDINLIFCYIPFPIVFYFMVLFFYK